MKIVFCLFEKGAYPTNNMSSMESKILRPEGGITIF